MIKPCKIGPKSTFSPLLSTSWAPRSSSKSRSATEEMSLALGAGSSGSGGGASFGGGGAFAAPPDRLELLADELLLRRRPPRAQFTALRNQGRAPQSPAWHTAKKCRRLFELWRFGACSEAWPTCSYGRPLALGL